jgi:hypothetical protein
MNQALHLMERLSSQHIKEIERRQVIKDSFLL